MIPCLFALVSTLFFVFVFLIPSAGGRCPPIATHDPNFRLRPPHDGNRSANNRRGCDSHRRQ
ncbi:hypothetical protein CONPUDRAFT_84618 [Coniophora puteana RWD-64-598 SS2]|uniref:Secreted protein n=1 Tax=Coniophora puteana (strain RWD-64-598) TaxID=741705 RepID=A0A5M3MDF5_CONPW|nr:uncharacterized protein CONPUDRAFT_84618 [Coniophora puteana RWD-64-598 SS2]EIW76655.1 hypothetical protein CONPUDRAFT_84618 [Coniophora puteana RWD-64-598 SS2]